MLSHAPLLYDGRLHEGEIVFGVFEILIVGIHPS